ncbi:MAG: hypothetical protein OH337_03850 [Candidatus Parvarchaeota archaeon]|nr:hypothetical protein [Candidatus Haiyanarchaeum thermophilum]
MGENQGERGNPLIMDLAQRVSKLETRVEGLEKLTTMLYDRIRSLEDKVDRIDSRIWYVLSGVIASIAIQILMRLIS